MIFPNPNAPTSIYEDLEFVEDIIRHNQDVIVIVDEAYIDFAGESALSLLDKYDNLIITQTFSKARSMAGMRIGYAIASPLLIKYLNDAKYSFNSYTMNKTSLVYGAEAVKIKNILLRQHVKLWRQETGQKKNSKSSALYSQNQAQTSSLYHIRNTMQKNSLKQ